MVVSVAIMTLILSAGYACLRSGILSQKLVDTRIDALQNARAALNLIATDLRAACRLSDKYEFLGMNREIGEVEADNVDFGTRHYTPQSPGETDFCETSYFLRKDPKTGSLTLCRRRDASPDTEPLAGGTVEPLVEGVKSLKLEYYDGYDWYDEWGDPQEKRKGEPDLRGRSNLSGLPEAVRITLSIQVGRSSKSKSAQSRVATSEKSPEEDPPFVVQTVARLNLAALAATTGGPAAGSPSSPSKTGGTQ